ncbi:MAG TPA: chemotaxis protein CheW [Steroidobacteraceae bacterium]|jgi:purine-binding chemotaxis protein CheW
MTSVLPHSAPPFSADEIARLVVFRLDEQRYALPLATVERIVRAVAITPLPKAPAIVHGVIDVEGSVLPVFNMRRRFRLPERPIGLEDQLSIATTTHGRVALVIDAAEGVIERPASAIVQAAALTAGVEHIHGVIRLDDGLVLIHDLEQFLTADETEALEQALIAGAAHAD